jgi:hypothetical protein
MPVGEVYATWSDKKRKYRERDDDEYTKILHQEKD